MKWRVGAILGGGILAVTPCLGLAFTSVAAASSPTTAANLLAQAMADARSAGWVHEVTLNVGDGHRQTMDDDIGTSSGRQVIDDNGGRMTVLVVGGTTYVQGDAKALHNDLGAPSQDASQLAGHWLSIPPGNQLYGPVSDAVTLASDFQQARLKGPLKEGRQMRIDGRTTVPITGTFSGTPNHERITATIYVSTGSQPLPIEYRGSGHGVSAQTRWTSWGRPVLLNPPPDAVSIGDGGSS
jgi:hypothetical protein